MDLLVDKACVGGGIIRNALLVLLVLALLSEGAVVKLPLPKMKKKHGCEEETVLLAATNKDWKRDDDSDKTTTTSVTATTDTISVAVMVGDSK